MTDTTVPPTSTKRRLGLWFALLGGGVAWLLHLLLAYLIAEFGCIAGWGHVIFMQITVVSWLLIIVSVVMVALAIAATIIGWRLRPQWEDEKAQELERSGGDITGYMARAGWMTSGLFVLVIIAESLPILFYLGRC